MKRRFSLFLTVALMLTLVTVPTFAKTSVRAGDNGKVEVTFTYAGNLDANAVYVAGEFNNWLPNFPTYKMKKENGVWTLTTQLEKGEYQYKFTVYGGGMLQWVADEDAASFAPDGYGGQNSVVIADPNAGLADRIVALEKQMAVTNIGFNYNGYARSGYVMNTNGGAASNRLPSSFRLGNETDTYFENIFSKKWTKDDGSWMKAEFLLAHSSGQDTNWEEGLAVREAFVEGGGFDFAPNLTFWAGDRFYGRSDIHITDFYWRDFSGYGAGVQGINLGSAKLDIAFIGRSGWDGNVFENVGEQSQQNIDIRIKDIAFAGGNLEFELTPSWSKGDENEATAEDQTGFQLAGIYNTTNFYGLTDGFTTTAIQYGEELGASLGSVNGMGNGEDQSAFRFLTYGLANVNDSWDIMPQFVYNLNDDGTNDTSEIVTGARFTNYITKNFAMQYELGFNYKDPDNADKEKVAKFTVAPTIKWDSSFWSRPELRVFLTYAKGNDAAGFADEYDDNSGMNYGMQMEVWW